MSTAKASLEILREVEGSGGSLLISHSGAELLCRDAPSAFSDETLTNIGHRVKNALAAIEVALAGSTEITLVFAFGSVTARACCHGVVVLLGEASLDSAMARVALTICTSQLDGLDIIESRTIDHSQGASEAAPQPPPTQPKRKKKRGDIWA